MKTYSRSKTNAVEEDFLLLAKKHQIKRNIHLQHEVKQLQSITMSL